MHLGSILGGPGRRGGAVIGLFVSLGGCQTPAPDPPPSAATGTSLSPDRGGPVVVLTLEDQAQVKRVFRDFAGEHEVLQRPQPASYGIRWSDMDAAVAAACDDAEMAVVERTDLDDGTRYVYRIETIDDRPATLTVTRRDPPAIYEAHAEVGLFRDDTASADALLAALRKALLDLGGKRKFPERDG